MAVVLIYLRSEAPHSKDRVGSRSNVRAELFYFFAVLANFLLAPKSDGRAVRERLLKSTLYVSCQQPTAVTLPGGLAAVTVSSYGRGWQAGARHPILAVSKGECRVSECSALAVVEVCAGKGDRLDHGHPLGTPSRPGAE